MITRQTVRSVLMQSSKPLLVRPDLALVEISRLLGYSDPSHLTRSFRRWTGEAPSAYRRRECVHSHHSESVAVGHDSWERPVHETSRINAE